MVLIPLCLVGPFLQLQQFLFGIQFAFIFMIGIVTCSPFCLYKENHSSVNILHKNQKQIGYLATKPSTLYSKLLQFAWYQSFWSTIIASNWPCAFIKTQSVLVALTNNTVATLIHLILSVKISLLKICKYA